MKKKRKNFFMEKIMQYSRKNVHRKVKDRLFRFLFEKDRKALLQLYNALNGTDYADTSQLQVVTIESAVYIVMKNDLAFVVSGVLNLYEHQSTYNPNMPVRFLIYLVQEYQKVIEEAEESLYGEKRISLPTPQCIVFYNGEKEMPEEQVLRLSEAFENKGQEADVELKVRMLNINYGHNAELMQKCQVLDEYAQFVEISRAYAAKGGKMKDALEQAIDYCIENGILEEFLRKYRAEVVGMLLEEFDAKKYERSMKEAGREEGREEGRKQGIEEGRKEGQEQGQQSGDAQRLIKSVEELMKNLQTDLPRACGLIGVTVDEYERAKERTLD
ncbi:MAG: Rpn family recombination-promoting nuclease/putative transposase [Muribaculaceae bacterium]|nr:Rpn family recombination-promoting nuclease/putative transposase [Muribaculaceae bacterium]